MERILSLVRQYRAMLSYLFFGGVTTLVNLLTYYLCYHVLTLGNDPSVIVAWILSVLVAFLTNKPFVFQSHDWSPQVLFPEAASFFCCRLGSGIMELVLMHITVEMLAWPGMLMKLLINILVVIINYVASKLLVFRTKK